MKDPSQLTAADATHLFCYECEAEDEVALIVEPGKWPRPGELPFTCNNCGCDSTCWLLIEPLDGEPDPKDPLDRDRRPWNGGVERVHEIVEQP